MQEITALGRTMSLFSTSKKNAGNGAQRLGETRQPISGSALLTPAVHAAFHPTAQADSVHFTGSKKPPKRPRIDPLPEGSTESSSDDEPMLPLPPHQNPKGQPGMNTLMQLLAGSAQASTKETSVNPGKLMAQNIKHLQAEDSEWEAYKTVAEPYAKQLAEIIDSPYLHHAILQGNNEPLQHAILMTLKEKAKQKSFFSVECAPDNLYDVQDYYDGPALVNAFSEPARSLGAPTQKSTVFFLKNADQDELKALQNKKLFQWIQKKNPHFRFVVAQPQQNEGPKGEGNIKISLGGLFGGAKSGATGGAPFDTVNVLPMDTHQWSTVLPQDKDAKQILKHWHLDCSPETLKLLLDGIKPKPPATLERETILGHLDKLGRFVRTRQNEPAGTKVLAEHVQSFLNSLEPAKSEKAGLLSSEPLEQKPYKILHAKDIQTRLTDVVGHEQAKTVLREVLDMTKYPALYAHLNKGDEDAQNHLVLLMGEPGGGKTMLAKALAGEGHGTFISTSGSQFVNVFVGMGANNMRQLKSAIENATNDLVVVFMDEIDSLGNRSSRASGSGSREETQTINQFLAITEGIEQSQKKVLLIGATNRPEFLDDAILSRFHHKIQVEKLTGAQRKVLFSQQMRQKKLTPDKSVEMDDLVKLTDGFSGRDIRNVLKLSKNALIQQIPREEKEHLNQDPAKLQDLKLNLTQDVLLKAIADIKKGWTDANPVLNDKPSPEVMHSMYT